MMWEVFAKITMRILSGKISFEILSNYFFNFIFIYLFNLFQLNLLNYKIFLCNIFLFNFSLFNPLLFNFFLTLFLPLNLFFVNLFLRIRGKNYIKYIIPVKCISNNLHISNLPVLIGCSHNFDRVFRMK